MSSAASPVNNNRSKPNMSKSKSKAKRGVYSSDDPTKIFEFVEQLGKGSYGGVVKARDTRDDSVVAIKIVTIETDNTKELIREIAILSKCRSKYIVNYCGSYRHKDEIWITMEYCGAGSVGDVIKITKKSLKEDQIAVIAKHTLSGLKYLHKNNIIHRDIKAGNILLNHLGQCKLADFGVSAQLAQTISRRNTVIGSPYWMAPEVLKQNNYDQKADIWSMGISIIEMSEGKPPLSDLHPLRALLQIPSNPAPKLQNQNEWTQEMHSFLALCLEKDPQKRSTAADLLKHPFIKNAGKKTIIQQLVLNVMPKIEKYREQKRKKDMEEAAKREEEKKERELKEKANGKSKRGSKKKKKKKRRKIFNAEPASDDEQYKSPISSPQRSANTYKNANNNGNYGNNNNEEVFDDSTMIITETNDNNNNNDNQYDEYMNGKTNNGQQNGNKNKHNKYEEEEDPNKYATMIKREKPEISEQEEKILLDANIDIRSPEFIVSPLFTERSIIYKEFELDDYIPNDPSQEQLMEIRKSLWTAYWKDKQILEDYYIDCRRQIRELLDKMKQQKKKKKRSSNKSSGKSSKKSSSKSSPNK